MKDRRALFNVRYVGATCIMLLRNAIKKQQLHR